MAEAAAIPETLFTVWTNLFERAYATEGDTVLVHGGTSGIGTMAIALCGLFGIDIIVTAGSEAKCQAALGLGATHAINYKTADFVERVKAITDGDAIVIHVLKPKVEAPAAGEPGATTAEPEVITRKKPEEETEEKK